MTVLVTGGNGFIGFHVVKKLDEKGIPVIVIDKKESSDNYGNLIKVDINDLDALSNIMANNDLQAVIHLVGFPNIGDCEKEPMTSFKLNTLSTQNVVEAMRKTDVEKIVFASSASVYGYQAKGKVSEEEMPRPDTIYGLHKLFSEQIIKSYGEKYGIKFVILRLFNVYGGDPTFRNDVVSLFIKQILNRRPLVLMGPKKFRDFIHIEDVAQAFLMACNSGIENKVFNIGSGVKITLDQLANIFKKVVPSIQVIEKNTPDDGTGIFADITLAKSLLAFNPRDPIEGLRKHIQQYAVSLYVLLT
jgi:UDP-glucose 4-epimerase